jgi:UDP-N-acetylglucosamine/UDP-N-acetyl-alpha-D-glucosaminouronate 4-epimerase
MAHAPLVRRVAARPDNSGPIRIDQERNLSVRPVYQIDYTLWYGASHPRRPLCARDALCNDRGMSRYLVTGGAGFIGSHLVEALVARGHLVRVVDNLTTGRRVNLHHIPGVEFLFGDLSDLQVARLATDDVDIVLHQAAMASVPRSISDPIASHHANVTATLNVLVASREAGVARVVFAGSSAAYGDTTRLPTDEQTAVSPLSPYALQKLVGEGYCRLFAELYGLETVTTRYFNVFGPRQDPSSPYSGVISLFAAAMLQGRAPIVYGDGEQTRDFTYVANVVDAVLRAAEADMPRGEIINVAAGARVSLNELIASINASLGTDLQPVYKNARAGDVRHSQADISKARALLGYEPTVTFSNGISRTIQWCRARATVSV